MEQEQALRWIFVLIFSSAILMSGFFRRKARQSGGAIARKQEGGLFLAARALVAGPFFLAVLAYMVNPAWMEWAAIPLPLWLRWLGAAAAAATLPFLFWTLKSLGSSISETYLTKNNHTLVAHGPYRWIRHPLYSGSTIAFVSLGLVAANLFIIGMALAMIVLICWFVIPREEAELVDRFGEHYRMLIARTGKLAPRLRRSR